MFSVNYFKWYALDLSKSDQKTESLSREIVILARHCPLTSHYFEP